MAIYERLKTATTDSNGCRELESSKADCAGRLESKLNNSWGEWKSDNVKKKKKKKKKNNNHNTKKESHSIDTFIRKTVSRTLA